MKWYTFKGGSYVQMVLSLSEKNYLLYEESLLQEGVQLNCINVSVSFSEHGSTL